jgi:hypothetical protein
MFTIYDKKKLGAWPWGITISSLYFFIVLSAIVLHHINKIFKILKKMWIFCTHFILMLPSSVLRTVPGPLDLYNPYGSILKIFDFSVQNVYQMHLDSAFFLRLNHIPINYMISIRNIFLEQ